MIDKRQLDLGGGFDRERLVARGSLFKVANISP